MNKDLKEEREGKEMMSRTRTSSVPEPQNASCVRYQQGIQSQVMGGGQNRTPPDIAQHLTTLKAVGSSCSH